MYINIYIYKMWADFYIMNEAILYSLGDTKMLNNSLLWYAYTYIYRFQLRN